MKQIIIQLTFILLFLTSCGSRNSSEANIEAAEETDTLALVAEIPEELLEDMDSEPQIRIDTMSAEEIREAFVRAMSQDSAPEYTGGKYSHLRQLPDSIQNILINEVIDRSTYIKQFISTPQWECVLERLPDSDKLSFEGGRDTTYYCFPDKYIINIKNLMTLNRFTGEFTRDTVLEDSILPIKENFGATNCRVTCITPDTVKLYISYGFLSAAFLGEVYLSLAKDGNFSINKQTFYYSGSDADD